jgi:hypothetical protein
MSQISPQQFLKLESRLLGRNPRPDGSAAVPEADRDCRIRELAADGEPACRIAPAVGVGLRRVRLVLGRQHSRRRR